jgi:hypothetical protein
MSSGMKFASQVSSELPLDLTHTVFMRAVSRGCGQNAELPKKHALEAVSGRFKKRRQGLRTGKTVTNRGTGAVILSRLGVLADEGSPKWRCQV